MEHVEKKLKKKKTNRWNKLQEMIRSEKAEFISLKPQEKRKCISAFLLRRFLDVVILVIVILAVRRLVSYIPILKTADAGAWLDFCGSLFGGAVSMIGIAWTLHYERERDREQKRLNSQPILVIRHKEMGNVTGTEVGIMRFYRVILFQGPYDDLSSEEYEEEEQQIILTSSELILKNVGQNAAINVDLTLILSDGTKSYNGEEAYTHNIAYLAADEYVVLKILMPSIVQNVIKEFEWKTIDDTSSYNIERSYPFIYVHYDKNRWEEIAYIACLRFVLKMDYSDIYGEKMSRSSLIRVYAIRFDNGEIDMIADNAMRYYREPEY